MNIFVLDRDIRKCAEYHGNRHCIKMILETAQLLSTAIKLKDQSVEGLYGISHHNHPCSVWTRKSKQNFMWLAELGMALGEEYTHRYYKTHKSTEVICRAYEYADLFPDIGLTPFAQAMPNEFKHDDAVIAYRNYYRTAKKHLLQYKNRDIPKWI